MKRRAGFASENHYSRNRQYLYPVAVGILHTYLPLIPNCNHPTLRQNLTTIWTAQQWPPSLSFILKQAYFSRKNLPFLKNLSFISNKNFPTPPPPISKKLSVICLFFHFLINRFQFFFSFETKKIPFRWFLWILFCLTDSTTASPKNTRTLGAPPLMLSRCGYMRSTDKTLCPELPHIPPVPYHLPLITSNIISGYFD